jgi:hypothetical protein
VIGLLDLPDVTENYASGACASAQSVELRQGPSAAASVAGAIYMRSDPEHGCALFFRRARTAVDEQLPSEESGYEVIAAVVYERRGRWFRIAIPQGSAWIERAGADEFLPYPRLLRERLSYLRRDWDGQLRRSPGGGGRIEPLPVEWRNQISRQIGVEVIGTTRIGNEDWIRVRFDLERCGSESVSRLPPVEGWVPAYRSNGTPVVWFYSRGC